MPPTPKTVILKITGNYADNLSIELEIRHANNNKLVSHDCCQLSPFPQELRNTYQDWRKSYLTWGEAWGKWLAITPPTQPIETNISIQVVDNLREQLIQDFNEWLSSSRELARIRENILEHVPPIEYRNCPELLSLVIHTNTNDPPLNLDLQKLPWNEWELVRDRYRTGVALSTKISPIVFPHEQKFKALAICGKYSNPDLQIDLTPDLTALKQHFGDKIDLEIWIADPSHNTKLNLLQKLRTETYHLVFFSGHSSANHQIQLNDTEYISTNNPQFTNILRGLKERGLILAFFNSCDGLGIAGDLMSVGIPYIVVMKELVHDSVAQEFIKRFLENAIQAGVPIHVAVNKARETLQWIEELPHGSFLPVLFQNPEQPAFYLTPDRLLDPEASLSDLPANKIIDVDRKSLINRMRFSLKKRAIRYLSISILAVFCFWGIDRYLNPPRLPICQFVAINNERISCGDKILFNGSVGSSSDKIAGFDTIADSLKNPQHPQYEAAINKLNTYWNNTSDPETRIAIENAKLEIELNKNPQLEIKNIAVVVPATTNTPPFIADSILKGVAFAQISHNQIPKVRWKLRVLIADDRNDRGRGRKIAKELVGRDDIMAIIGHYSSEVTLSTIDIYHQGKTVSISPTATSYELENKSDFFFRIVNESTYAAKQMADRWVTPDSRMIVFYDESKAFSRSLTYKLKAAVRAKFPGNNNLFFKDVSLADNNMNIKNEIDRAIRDGANSIVLFPDAYTGNAATNPRSEQVIQANDGRLRILGNTSIYDLYNQRNSDRQTTNVSAKLYQKLVLSVPWDSSNSAESLKKINYPSWWKSDGKVEQRIAMSYDATLVLLNAMENAKHRLDIQKVISGFHFKLEGVTGSIDFDGSERKLKTNYLITPDCQGNECRGFKKYRA